MALHMGNMALRLAEYLTIYTNGDDLMSERIKKTMAKPSPRISLETRKIARLRMESDGASHVVVAFEDGSTRTEGFIVSHSVLIFDVTSV